MSLESALRDGSAANFDLIETMRWEPGSGFLRFERHLARLYGSAAELGFRHDPGKVGEGEDLFKGKHKKVALRP